MPSAEDPTVTRTPPGTCTIPQAAQRLGCDRTVLEDLADTFDLGVARHVYWTADGARVPLVDLAALEGWG